MTDAASRPIDEERQRANLVELWHRVAVGTTATRALDLLREEIDPARRHVLDDKPPRSLATLLRHHRDAAIIDAEELVLRRAFDDLLLAFSYVEVAAIAGFVPTPLTAELEDDVRLALGQPDVQTFYRINYPLLLPDMLFARVTGQTARLEMEGAAAAPLFMEFLQISGLLDDDAGVDMLLWFLDDGWLDGEGWPETVRILQSPERLLAALETPVDQRGPAQLAAGGLRTFLAFCVALDDLLQRTRAYPLLRAGMWHLHAYWFDTLQGPVRSGLLEALAAFEAWSGPPPADLDPATREALTDEARRSVEELSAVTRRLTGPEYGREITARAHVIRSEGLRATRRLRGKDDPGVLNASERALRELALRRAQLRQERANGGKTDDETPARRDPPPASRKPRTNS